MRKLLVGVGLALIAGCATGARVTISDAQGRATQTDYAQLVAEHPLADGQNISSQLLGRTDVMSYHVVQIRDREQLHIHATHDLAVTVLRGEGQLFIRQVAQAMRSGDVAIVPHGTPHYFVNQGSKPAVAFVTFAPPYDGTDQLPAAP